MRQPLLPILNAAFVGVALLLLLPMAAHAQTMEPEYSDLYLAVDRNDLEEVRRLLDGGADVGENYDGYTLLHEAANDGSVALMELLLDRGANVNAREKYGYTPLMYAAGNTYSPYDLQEKRGIRGVNLLLNHGANPNIVARPNPESQTQIGGFTALHIVAAVNSVKTSCGSPGGCMPITLGESELALSRQVAEALVNRGANVHARDSAGKTPLDYAKEFGPPEYAAFFASLMNAPVSGDAGVIVQIRAEIDALRMEIAALRALISTNCGAQPCQGTSAQQERLQGLENQIARKASQAAVLEATASSGGGGGGGGGSGLALGLGAAALLGIAVYALSPAGDAEAFSLRPLASYEYRDGAEALHYGMRLDYRRDSWGLWWSADDSRLGWGGEWRNDRLRAHAEVWDIGGAQDVSAGLGAEWDLVGWSIRPSWRMRGSADWGGAWTWNSGADLTAEWSGHGWMVRPSVRALDLEKPADSLFHLRVAREF